MLTERDIVKMNSDNVVVNKNYATERFLGFWTGAPNAQKNQAVRLGQYSSTRSFTNQGNKGAFSARMVIALCETFHVNPFWICGEPEEENAKNDYSPATVNAFLTRHGFENLCVPEQEEEDAPPDADGATVSEKIKNYAAEITISTGDLSEGETLDYVAASAMLKILFCRCGDSPRLALIKFLLASAKWPEV